VDRAFGCGLQLCSLRRDYFSGSAAAALLPFSLGSGSNTGGGAIIGGTGLIALSLGGFLADWAQRKNKNGRLLVSVGALTLGAILTWFGLMAESASEFAWLFGAGWMLAYLYSPCIYPALQDLVVPQMRATAMGTYFAILYLFGAAFGSVAVGALSDHYADKARLVAGVLEITQTHRATGLHDALVIVPMALLVAAVACWVVTRLPHVGAPNLKT
jgi:MFS family permease